MTLTTSSTPSDCALEYASRGWKVFPIHSIRNGACSCGQADCSNKGKHPRTENGLKDASCDTVVIKRWWMRWPDANIGVATGSTSGVSVLDIDPRHGGDASFEELESRLGKLAIGLRAKTGGGGQHIFFLDAGGKISNRVNAMPGLDWRGTGGYVVVPPSTHESGGRYEWQNDLQPIMLTPAVLQWAGTKETPEHKGNWIEQVLGGAPEGGRNNSCARLAGYFLGKGIAPDIVTSLLLTTFAPRCMPPMREEEVRRTVYSVAKNEKHGKKPTSFEVTHIDEFMTQHSDAVTNWTIDEWLPEGAVTFLVAPPGTYKTWLLLDLALSIATGANFLGKYKVNTPGPVIVVQQEDHKSGIASRLGKIWHSRFPMRRPKQLGDEFDMPDNRVPIWVHETRSLRLDSAESIAALGEQVAKLRPRAVLIDPLYSTLSTDDYMASAAEQMLALKTLRDEYNTSFVIAHHTRKKQDEGRLGAWGSQFLNAFIETGWQIRRAEDSGEMITVLRHHKVSSPLPAITLDWVINDNSYEVKVAGVEEMSDISQAILTALTTKPHTIQELAEIIKTHRSTISRRLNAMQKDGLVMKDGQNWTLTPGL